jgi:hypothetical protein
MSISLPDAIFREAERLASRLKKSSAQLFQEALGEYLARHDPEAITEGIDGLVKRLDSSPDEFTSAAARRVLRRSDW